MVVTIFLNCINLLKKESSIWKYRKSAFKKNICFFLKLNISIRPKKKIGINLTGENIGKHYYYPCLSLFFIFSKINNLNTCKAGDASDDACYTYNECLLYIIDERNNSRQSNYHFLSQDEALSFRQLKYVWMTYLSHSVTFPDLLVHI